MSFFVKKKTFIPMHIQRMVEAVNQGASPRVIAGIINNHLVKMTSDKDLEACLADSIYRTDYDFLHDRYSIGTVAGIQNNRNAPINQETLKDVVLGVAFGDIAGSVLEGKDFDPALLPNDPADWITSQHRSTDDTLLTLATLRTLEQKDNELDVLYNSWLGDPDFVLASNPFTEEYKNCVKQYPNAGWGWHFYEWSRTEDAVPYKSYGDGAAMRVAPIGAWYRDPDRVVFTAAVSAAASHNHPEGIKGAIVTAACVWMALRRYPKADIRRYLLEHYRHNAYGFRDFSLDEIYNHIPETKRDSSCMFAVPAAVICFLEADNYEAAIRNACSFCGDTDTMAAIAGGIAAAYYNFPDRLKAIVIDKCKEIR